MFFLLTVLLFVRSEVVPLATFDGADKTTFDWQTVNDPVMGGQSHSEFKLDSDNERGVWVGAVEIVPFLHAPGFCNLQAPGYGQKAVFNDISGAKGIVVDAAQTNSTGLTHFNTMLTTSGAVKFYKQGVYIANMTLSSELKRQVVPLSSFVCTWRGEDIKWCPPIESQLDKITNIGIGTAFPGKAGSFEVMLSFVGAEM